MGIEVHAYIFLDIGNNIRRKIMIPFFVGFSGCQSSSVVSHFITRSPNPPNGNLVQLMQQINTAVGNPTPVPPNLIAMPDVVHNHLRVILHSNI